MHLDYFYSWNNAKHGSGLNACLGRAGRGIREPKVLDQASHAHCKPELGKHESELPIAMLTSLQQKIGTVFGPCSLPSAHSSRNQPIKSLRSGGAAGGSSLGDRARKSVRRSKPGLLLESRELEDPSQEPKEQKYHSRLGSSCPVFSRAQTRPLHQKSWGHKVRAQATTQGPDHYLPDQRDGAASLKVISQKLPLNGTAAFRSKKAVEPWPPVLCCFPKVPARLHPNRKRGISALHGRGARTSWETTPATLGPCLASTLSGPFNIAYKRTAPRKPILTVTYRSPLR